MAGVDRVDEVDGWMGRESRWLDEVEREYGWIGQMEMSDGVERWVDGIEDIW